MEEGKVAGLKSMTILLGSIGVITIVGVTLYLLFAGPNYCPEIDNMNESNPNLVFKLSEIHYLGLMQMVVRVFQHL